MQVNMEVQLNCVALQPPELTEAGRQAGLQLTRANSAPVRQDAKLHSLDYNHLNLTLRHELRRQRASKRTLSRCKAFRCHCVLAHEQLLIARFDHLQQDRTAEGIASSVLSTTTCPASQLYCSTTPATRCTLRALPGTN